MPQRNCKTMEWTDKIRVTNEDNIQLMSRYPDNYFELAIVDPPYGMPKSSTHRRGKLKNRILNSNNIQRWDIKPNDDYFKKLFRVSKNQIIWGGNYFALPASRGFVIWDKQQPFENFSAAEYAWISFQTVSKIYRLPATRTGDKKRIHPTQKPVALYKWLLMNYAKENDKILDTHLGSGSIALACHELGFSLTACELDLEYYEAAHKRFKEQTAQLRLKL